MYVQTGFQQRLSISLLDEPSRQGTMPSKRGIVETVHRGNKLNEGSKWQVQTLARFHKQRTSRTIQRVGLTERVLEVCDRQHQITQLQQKKEYHDTLCLWSGCVGEHVGSVRILVSQNTPSGLGFRFLESALLRLESSHHSTVDHPVWLLLSYRVGNF